MGAGQNIGPHEIGNIVKGLETSPNRISGGAWPSIGSMTKRRSNPFWHPHATASKGPIYLMKLSRLDCMVTAIFTSWNQMSGWLSQLQGLPRAWIVKRGRSSQSLPAGWIPVFGASEPIAEHCGVYRYRSRSLAGRAISM